MLAEPPGAAGGTARPGALSDRALSGTAVGVAPAALQSLETAVRARPENADALVQLGWAALQA